MGRRSTSLCSHGDWGEEEKRSTPESTGVTEGLAVQADAGLAVQANRFPPQWHGGLQSGLEPGAEADWLTKAPIPGTVSSHNAPAILPPSKH